MKKLILLAALVFVSVTFTVAQFTVTSIDFPGGTLTTARGINNHGEIVGAYRIVPPRHALLIKGGQYIPLAPTTVLGTNYSEAFKNNDRGDVVGEYLDDAGFTHGFLLSKKGVLTTLDFPGSSDTAAWGINESGTVVGNWDLLDSGGNLITTHGFTWDNGSFTQVDFPGSANTSVFGINARGDLVGEWDDGIVGHGFIRTNTNQFASFDVPVGGAQYTQLDDINANGQLLGVYIDAGGAEHGFLKAGAMFTSIDYPGAVTTTAWGINSAGKMVGNWYDSSGAAHGWLAQTQGSTSLLFKADFNTNVLPSTLEESGPSPIYADGAVTFPDYWNESRRYLRTKANYNTTNFIAEVTVTIQGGYGGPGIAFFGLGAGVADPNFYLEPRVPPTAYARIEPDDFGDGALSITTSSLENIGNIVEAAGDGTHRVRIIWDHVNRTFTVAIQKNYTGGPFSPTSTIQAVVHESFGDINTRIFFGGAGYSVWDDLWVLALNGTPRMSNCHGQSVFGLTQQFSGMDHAASAFGFASVNVLQNVIRDFCGN